MLAWGLVGLLALWPAQAFGPRMLAGQQQPRAGNALRRKTTAPPAPPQTGLEFTDRLASRYRPHKAGALSPPGAKFRIFYDAQQDKFLFQVSSPEHTAVSIVVSFPWQSLVPFHVLCSSFGCPQTAVTRLRKEEREVLLYSTVHMADPSYFRELENSCGADCDVVLYELITSSQNTVALVRTLPSMFSIVMDVGGSCESCVVSVKAREGRRGAWPLRAGWRLGQLRSRGTRSRKAILMPLPS
jgi:hypothetical protein